MSHAKAILFGEHSVIYNKKAIGIPLRNIIINVEITKDKIIEDEHVKYIKDLIKGRYNIKEEIYFRINSDIPMSAGLGSSAALAIAIAKEVGKKYNIDVDIFDIVNISEDKAHGKSSGLDLQIIANSKPIIFEKNKGIKLFNFNLSKYLVIANTGIKGNTKDAVSQVANNIEKNMKYIDELGNITEDAINSIVENNVYLLGKLMRKAQENLRKLGLSNDNIEKLINIGRDISIGEKITGAGLGGCIIFLVENLKDAKKLSEKLLDGGAKQTWIEGI
ncbi:mevalonate kinase [Pseudostreptobacillus hongkongensis]|uniref:mevalonate kinase n=1 Tax=Pseudostreptobacillus hongkongensis TaxID=1162717 RepID=UPI0028D36663|nr:mevalonate kinase [Pseudostreptobacillus hongkongensis]